MTQAEFDPSSKKSWADQMDELEDDLKFAERFTLTSQSNTPDNKKVQYPKPNYRTKKVRQVNPLCNVCDSGLAQVFWEESYAKFKPLCKKCLDNTHKGYKMEKTIDVFPLKCWKCKENQNLHMMSIRRSLYKIVCNQCIKE